MTQYFGEPWDKEDTVRKLADCSSYFDEACIERAVACVNFCQHLPTETLEALTKQRIGAATLVQWIRKSHVYHEDFGACAASDSEWGEVCIECNHRIDLTRLHAEDCLLKQALDIIGTDV